MTISSEWQPSASVELLKQRAHILQRIRIFFVERELTEVETPIFSHFAGTEPNLNAVTADLKLRGKSCEGFLQTSPEYAMKRLLSAGMGDCFQISRVFRADEQGRFHNPEFSLLEWYRLNFDDRKLLEEVEQFLHEILNCGAAEYCEYQQLFVKFLEIDPLKATFKELQNCTKKVMEYPPELDSKDDYLQLLFSACIEPKIGFERPCFVTDYPASQASLARINADNPQLSCRFEVFFKGIELGNGFYELNDAEEQQQRFVEENKRRQKMGIETMEIDTRLIEALQHGLPDCSGIAIGIDRLVMLATDAKHINEVMAFPVDRA